MWVLFEGGASLDHHLGLFSPRAAAILLFFLSSLPRLWACFKMFEVSFQPFYVNAQLLCGECLQPLKGWVAGWAESPCMDGFVITLSPDLFFSRST